jgi:hypothetical protein
VVIDHLDCGAYKSCVLDSLFASDQDPGVHSDQFNTLKSVVAGSRNYYNNSTNLPITGTTKFGGSRFLGLIFDGLESSNTTNLENYQGTTFPPPYPKGNNSGAKVMVLGCIDPKYCSALNEFLTQYVGVDFIFDMFTLAGASLGVNQSYDYATHVFPSARPNGHSGSDYPLNLLAENGAGIGNIGETWGQTFFDHLSAAKSLHDITEVWIFDHLDCGGYKAIKIGNISSPDTSRDSHLEEIIKLNKYIKSFTEDLDPANGSYSVAVKGFLIEERSAITKIFDDGRGVTFEVSPNFGSSNIKNPASIITDNIAAAKSDFTMISEIPVTVGRGSFGSFGRQTKVLSSSCISCTPTILQKVPTFSSSAHQHLRLV